jgi:hypothetical protein
VWRSSGKDVASNGAERARQVDAADGGKAKMRTGAVSFR